jgi:hypothetical protein
MISRTRLLLSAAASAALLPMAAFGWGPDGHRMIGELAMQGLPADLPAFLRTADAADEVGYLAPEPDRIRGAGQTQDAEHDPAHFVDVSDDLTILGGPPLKALPPTREAYDTALRAVNATQYKAGYLPYSIVSGFQILARDLAYWRVDAAGETLGKTDAERAWYAKDKSRREAIALHDLGLWSHFVGDGSMPLHASVHYNGWGDYPNPQGFTLEHVHVPWENAYVHNYVKQEAVAAAMAPYRDCACAIDVRTADYLAATHDQVIPFYTLEKAGAFKGPTPEGLDFTTKAVARGASELRDMVVDAWHASDSESVGYPAVKVSDVEAGEADPYDALTY